jgi:hypothetical protein
MGAGLSRPDILTQVFLLGTLFDMAREHRDEAEANQLLRSVVYDLQVRLDTTFELTAEQRVSA